MNLSQAAKALDLNRRTLELWINNDQLKEFFSTPARLSNAARNVSEDDLIVLNTIMNWRDGKPNINVDWSEIAEQLRNGRRDRSLPPSAITANTQISVLAQHERSIALTVERDNAVRLANEYRQQLQDERQGRLTDRDRMMERIIEAEQRAAKAETELELYRSGRLQPERADKNGTS